MSGGNHFRDKFYGEWATFREDSFPRGQFFLGAIVREAIFLRGDYPRRQLSEGSIIRGAIILRGNFPGGQLFRGNFPRAQFDENDHLYVQNAEAQESSQLSEIRLKIFNYFRKNIHLR